MTSKTEGSTVAMAYSLEHMHAPNSVNHDKNGNAIFTGTDGFQFDVARGYNQGSQNRVGQTLNWSGFWIQSDYAYDAGGEPCKVPNGLTGPCGNGVPPLDELLYPSTTGTWGSNSGVAVS